MEEQPLLHADAERLNRIGRPKDLQLTRPEMGNKVTISSRSLDLMQDKIQRLEAILEAARRLFAQKSRYDPMDFAKLKHQIREYDGWRDNDYEEAVVSMQRIVQELEERLDHDV